jgi:hypothetical protein
MPQDCLCGSPDRFCASGPGPIQATGLLQGSTLDRRRLEAGAYQVASGRRLSQVILGERPHAKQGFAPVSAS